jgi:hypothetical protein
MYDDLDHLKSVCLDHEHLILDPFRLNIVKRGVLDDADGGAEADLLDMFSDLDKDLVFDGIGHRQWNSAAGGITILNWYKCVG